MQLHRPNPVLAILLCAVFWSTGGVLIKNIDWNPMAIAASRSIIAAITMMLILKRIPRIIIRTKDGGVDRKQTFCCLAGAVCYSATMILFVFANKLTTAANAILLQYTNPLYIIMLGPFILHEKNDRVDYIAVAGVFAGMLLVFKDGIQGGNGLGNILAALSGLSFALTTIFLREQKDGHPSDSFVIADVLTFAVMAPAYFLHPFPAPSAWLGIGALGVIELALPSVLYSLGIARVTAMSAVLLTMLEPLMNPVWVFLFNGEAPSLNAIVGGVVILSFLFARIVIKNRQSHQRT